MIRAVVLLDDKGEPIACRKYGFPLDPTAVEQLRAAVVGGSIRAPVFRQPPNIFVYKRVDTLHFFCSVAPYADTMGALHFLEQLNKVFQAFLKQKYTAVDLRRKIALVYEILDECVDAGEVQTTDPEVLKLFIVNGRKLDVTESKEQVTTQATGALSYRPQNLFYKNNEIFIDVYEQVNGMFNAVGQCLHSDVSGHIAVNSHLTGMPDCSFGFNDRLVAGSASGKSVTNKIAGFSQTGVVMDDVSFHHCVRLGNFAVDRSITFVPPDGEFQLMNFRITEEVKEPFSIKPIVTVHGRNRMEVMLNLKCNISSNLVAEKVVVAVPMPDNVSSVEAVESLGRCRLSRDGKEAEWRIRTINGSTNATLAMEVRCVDSATLDLREWRRPPISMRFEIPMYTASGLEVRYIRIVAKENYVASKWLKYICTAGTYQIRW